MYQSVLVLMLIASANAQGMPAIGGGGSVHAAPVSISFVDSCNGTTSCAVVPSHQTGDLFIVIAGRDGSQTAPSLPATWTSVTTASINGTSSNDSSVLIACKVATGSSETITGFTNSGSLVASIYRGSKAIAGGTCATDVLGTPSNFTSTVNTTTTTVTYNSITTANSASWVVGLGYAPAATAGIGTAPALMSNRGASGSTAAANDTNAGVASWTTANVTVTTAGRVITSTFEIKD